MSLGEPDVDGLLARLTSRQLSEWMAYGAVEPFGEDRADFRTAHALAVIVNLLRGKDAPPVKIADLIPQVGALAEEDREAWETSLDTVSSDTPPKHPNVLLFEKMVGR